MIQLIAYSIVVCYKCATPTHLTPSNMSETRFGFTVVINSIFIIWDLPWNWLGDITCDTYSCKLVLGLIPLINITGYSRMISVDNLVRILSWHIPICIISLLVMITQWTIWHFLTNTLSFHSWLPSRDLSSSSPSVFMQHSKRWDENKIQEIVLNLDNIRLQSEYIAHSSDIPLL